MSSRTRARAHAAQRYRHADPSPVAWRGLVIATPGAIDVDAIDGATVLTQRDAASIAAGLRKRAASAGRATAKVAAQLERRRADMDSALQARYEAAAHRAQATGRFEGFERALRAVVDATYSLVAANAEAAAAVARVEVTAGRVSELSAHRRALEVSAEEARHRADHAARLRSDQEAVTSLNAVVLARGTEVAERARVEAEAASTAWAALGEQLDELDAAAARDTASLRDVVDYLRGELAGRDAPDEVVVRNALSEYDAATSEPVDRLAVSLADRWAHVHHQLAELDRAEPQPSPRELATAKARLEAAEDALARAVEAAQSGTMTSVERQAIEDAHAAVVSKQRAWGRSSGQHHRRAESELQELLAAHGLASWLDYLTAGLSVDPLHQRAVTQAEQELVDARSALAQLEVALRPSPQRLAMTGAIEDIRRAITDVLGFWPEGDVTRHLRAQPLVVPALSAALFVALMDAGVPIGDVPIAAAARGWLEERDTRRAARSRLEAELARTVGHLDALATSGGVPEPADLAKLVTDATAIARARAEHCSRAEGLLRAALGALHGGRAEDGGPTSAASRDEALRWALVTVADAVRGAHRRATEDAELATAAVTASEEALASAWRALRQPATEPIRDLAAAVHRMEQLLEASGAATRAFGAAEDACKRAEAAFAAAEAALADHGGAPVGSPPEPTTEDIAAHLEELLGPGCTTVVLDDPFPSVDPATFERVVRVLSGLAADRLVVYLTDAAGAGQRSRPSVA